MNLKTLILALLPLAALPSSAQFSSAPAFPGAEGYGRFTTGGRGGKVYHVTTLADNVQNPPEGSLRYFISKKSGPRIIVFDVAGTIELKGHLRITSGDVSILGQTAPGNGICLRNYTLMVHADNVIIRFLRSRLGDVADADAMSATHRDRDVKKGIIIDHCSMSWSTDEVGSFYGNRNFTLQWCILSESLRASNAKSSTHGYGGIWGGEKASFHHNLMVSNDSRMPRFDHGYVSTLAGPVDFVNNVVYNWGSNSSYGGENKEGFPSKKINMIANYYKPGEASQCPTRILNPWTICKNCIGDNDVPGTFCIRDNYMEGSEEVTRNNLAEAAIEMQGNSPVTFAEWKRKYTVSEPFRADEDIFRYNIITMQSPEVVFSKVVATAGASLSRDDVDKRIAAETKSGKSTYKGSKGSKGGLIDSPEDVGGWPVLKGKAAKDTDGDGIPDEWEKKHGLDPRSDDSSAYTLDKKGYYTNIEVYANSLVEKIVKSEREEARESFEEYYPL